MSGGAGLRDEWIETPELNDDKFHDECGLFGVWNHAEAANVAYLGLYSLQHRGQESAGHRRPPTARAFHVEKAMGWVADVFSRDRLKRLPGHRAIGHVRYSTAGSSNLRNAQPISAQTAHGTVALGPQRQPRQRRGPPSRTSSGTARCSSPRRTPRSSSTSSPAPRAARLVDQLPRALSRVKGAYTLLLLTPNFMVGVRDPSGFRPLVARPPGRRAGSSPPRRAPSTSWKRSSCATSSPARWS